MMKYDIQAFNHLVRHRRSIFPNQYETGNTISMEASRRILENATWAPNHGNTEPWHFTVFSGDGLRKFAAFQSDLYKSEAGVAFKEAKYLKLGQQPLLASHVIAIGMKRSPEKKIPEIE